MRLTVAFPNVGQPQDRGALRDYAQALEGLGADTLFVVDHVVYAWPAEDGSRRAQYRADMWHLEALTTLAFLAGVTERVGLETGIMIVPQRPPILIAKEAATVDVLSNGRLRLGVGVGWQAPEYESLGVPFRQRGSRMEEALAVIKMAWTEQHLEHKGRYYSLPDVGMEPKPVQRPHPPILMGGGAQAVLERAARLADGWMAPTGTPLERFGPLKEAVDRAVKAAGRESEFGIFEGSLFPQSPDPSDLLPTLRGHRDRGATDMMLWLGAARDPELRAYDAKLRYVERLVKDVWREIG